VGEYIVIIRYRTAQCALHGRGLLINGPHVCPPRSKSTH